MSVMLTDVDFSDPTAEATHELLASTGLGSAWKRSTYDLGDVTFRRTPTYTSKVATVLDDNEFSNGVDIRIHRRSVNTGRHSHSPKSSDRRHARMTTSPTPMRGFAKRGGSRPGTSEFPAPVSPKHAQRSERGKAGRSTQTRDQLQDTMLSSGPNVINSATLRARLQECQHDGMDPVVADYVARFGRPSSQQTTSQASLTLTNPERFPRVTTTPGRFHYSPETGFVDTDPTRTVTANSFASTYRQFPEPDFPEPEAPDFPWRVEEVNKARKRGGSREAEIERPEMKERRRLTNSDEYHVYVKKKFKKEHFEQYLKEVYMSAGVTTHRTCPDIMEKGSARESAELGQLLSYYNESVWRNYLRSNAPRNPRTDEPVSCAVNDPQQEVHRVDITKAKRNLTQSVHKLEKLKKDIEKRQASPVSPKSEASRASMMRQVTSSKMSDSELSDGKKNMPTRMKTAVTGDTLGSMSIDRESHHSAY